MLKTVEGTFRNGKIELAEVPTEITRSRVLVTFVPEPSGNTGGEGGLRYGMFANEPGPMSTEEDFKLAQWRPREDVDGK